MIAVGQWFVMMYSQNMEYVMPLIDDDGEVMLWKTEGGNERSKVPQKFIKEVTMSNLFKGVS